MLSTGSTVSSVSTASEPRAAWASFGAITTTASERDSNEAHRELEDSAAAADAIADVAAASSTSAVEPARPTGMWLGMFGGSAPQGMGCSHHHGGMGRRFSMGQEQQQQAEEGVTTMYVAGEEGEEAMGEEECSSKCCRFRCAMLYAYQLGSLVELTCPDEGKEKCTDHFCFWSFMLLFPLFAVPVFGAEFMLA